MAGTRFLGEMFWLSRVSPWSSLYLTISRPFPAPATGKIAVKMINHYGDEVLKAYDV